MVNLASGPENEGLLSLSHHPIIVATVERRLTWGGQRLAETSCCRLLTGVLPTVGKSFPSFSSWAWPACGGLVVGRNIVRGTLSDSVGRFPPDERGEEGA